MKNLKNVRYAIAVVAACAAMGMATDAKAQTATMDASVVVSNLLTLTEDAQMNFGTIAAFKDTLAANVASVVLNPDGTLGTPTNSAPAVIAVIDPALASEAQITVTDGAPNATINIEIDNVVAPVSGGNSFTLTAFRTSWNGAAATLQTVGTPFPQVYADNAGAGSVLQIGATLGTAAGPGAQYTDATYAGTFDVIFAY